MKRIFEFFKRDAWLIAFALILMGLNVCASLLKPWPVALLVDSVFGALPFPAPLDAWLAGRDKPVLVLMLCAGALGLYAVQGSLNALQNYLAIRAGLRGRVDGA